jgi:4-diphosphocytidyl-2-C-methyl-D-erythritol kinase
LIQGLSETAFAKINLALHVRRRRKDGYHDLETLFAFVDSGDELSAHLADRISLDVAGPFGDELGNGQDNMVIRVATYLQLYFNISNGVALKLNKNLPVASGIGGGSADAAAAARLLNRLWRLDATDSQLEELLAPLGADIPACVQSQTMRGEGTGTTLSAVAGNDVANMQVLLVNPVLPVATGAVFKGWDGVDRGALAQGAALQVALTGRNDLENPALAICPPIVNILEILKATNPVLARMSGSGATCFALYNNANARNAAQSDVKAAHPDWWTLSGALR